MVVVDDSVSACSRPWVDAEDFHGQRLGVSADVPPAGDRAHAAVIVTDRRTVRAWPAESVVVTWTANFPARV